MNNNYDLNAFADDFPEYRECVGVLVCHGPKHILLLRRSAQEDSMVGLWELAGGKVEEGETLLEAALLELREETGLVPQEGESLHYYGTDHDHDKKKRYHLFLYEVNSQERDIDEVKVTCSFEHDAFQWLTPPEVRRLNREQMVSHHLMRFMSWLNIW